MGFLDANPITSKMDCSFESFCSFKEKKKWTSCLISGAILQMTRLSNKITGGGGELIPVSKLLI